MTDTVDARPPAIRAARHPGPNGRRRVVGSPDLAAMTRDEGIRAGRAGAPGELPEAVADTPARDGPAPSDVVTAMQGLSMPPAIDAERISGFGLRVPRAAMRGRGDAVPDPATTDLPPR